MKVNQLSIFIMNRKGRLYNTLDLIAKGGINIRALSLADTSEFGILRLVVDKPKEAKEILEKEDYIVKETPIIAVELNDTPGGLSSILKILNDEDIDLEYLYAFTHEKTNKAILLMQADDLDGLTDTLNKHDIPIVSPDEVYDL